MGAAEKEDDGSDSGDESSDGSERSNVSVSLTCSCIMYVRHVY
jgi:hypothetical protein